MCRAGISQVLEMCKSKSALDKEEKARSVGAAELNTKGVCCPQTYMPDVQAK